MRRHAPATERNREPILAVLREVLPPEATVLEVASGTGQHAAWFADALPRITWQPTDVDPQALPSIEAWREASGARNVLPAFRLDAEAGPWPQGPYDAVVAINLVHISPWSTTLALVEGARRALAPGGVLFLYGPYRRDGRHTSPSNATFDASLRARDPRWGVRDLEAVTQEALARGFVGERVVSMPANNLCVVFRRPPTEPLHDTRS